MLGRRLRAAVSILLLVGGLYVLTTGLWAEALDLNRSLYHRYGGYAVSVLALAHLWLNRKALAGQLKALTLRRKKPHPSRPIRHEEVPSPTRRAFLAALLAGAVGFLGGFLWPRRETAPVESADADRLYHEWSKLGVSSLPKAFVSWGGPPPPRKAYPDAPRVKLPRPQPLNALSLEEAIQRRRSIREYSPDPLSAEELSLLLHLTDGITARRYGIGFRSAPSAGALYPIEIYPIIRRVEGVAPGVYHYDVQEHALELLREGDFGAEMVRHCLGQQMPGDAAVTLVLTAVFQRTRWKYRERAYRYVMLEAGHIGQNVYLAAVAMGMGACAIGAFFDEPLNALLGVDGEEEAVVYVLTVGKRR